MRKVISILLLFCLLILSSCSNKTGKILCTACKSEISADSLFCSSCGKKLDSTSEEITEDFTILIEEKSSISNKSDDLIQNELTTNKENIKSQQYDIWTSCPINITGGISGSSNSEIITLNINNLTNKDIDSIKLLITFEHTNYDNTTEYISGFYTVDDTVWANGTVKAIIPGGNYNFLSAQVFPACVYYKNGDIWGNSSADYEKILNNSLPAYIEHFALNIGNEYEYEYNDSNEDDNDVNNDYYDNGGMLPHYGEDFDSWQGFDYLDDFDVNDVENEEEPVRDLDGIVDYGSDILSDE